MKKTEIGIVEIQYNKEGKLVSADFKPTMKVELTTQTLQNLERNVDTPGHPDIIKFNSDFVLGTFFAKMTEIELADREKQEVVSEVFLCEKYDTGSTFRCIIKYFFQDVLRPTAQA